LLLRQSSDDKAKQHRMGGKQLALREKQDQQRAEMATGHLLNRRLQGSFAKTKRGKTMA
jgi:hypothetical protein